ncbi:MAG: uroporphyrinogen decarboxylase [Rhodothalassiaceae bacterium]
MSQENAPSRLLRTIRGEVCDQVPVWFLRQAGRYLPEYRAVRARCGDFLDLVFNPDAATEVTLQPIERFDMDAAILFSDILVTPLALGQKVWFEQGEGPRLSPLHEIDWRKPVEPDQADRHLAPIYQTVRQIRQRLPADKALIGFAGAPWTVASYMVAGGSSKDHAPARDMARRQPNDFAILIERLTQITIDYVAGQIRAGADVVMLFDSWAGALAADQVGPWVLEPTRAIVAGLKALFPDTPVIGFPRGAGLHLPVYVETGVDCLHIDETVPAAWAAHTLQPRVCVQGNLDPRLMAVGGDTVASESRAVLGALAKGPHIFNLGHGLTPDSDPEAVRLAVETAHRFKEERAHV